MKKKIDPKKKKKVTPKKKYSYSRNSRQGSSDLPKKTDGTGYKEAFYGKKNKVKPKVKKSDGKAKATYYAKRKAAAKKKK